MTAGYSGTPLAKKLGLKPGTRAWFSAMPASVRAEIDPYTIGVVELDRPSAGMDAAHIFVTERAVLERQLFALRTLIQPAGQIWVSWPKKASKVPTDITEDTIRAVALPIGLVDVKVCAVDQIWSGLKLVIRRELRGVKGGVMGASGLRRIATATFVAGTLDILAAVVLTLIYGRQVPGMLRYVASGPFPDAKDWSAGGAVLGLGVHFTLMAFMATAFVLAADRFGQLKAQPLIWGIVYGLVTYAVMNLIVVPLRFGFHPSAMGIATQLFCHIVLVGIPIALIALIARR